MESIEITSPPDKTEYVKGEELDLTGLVVTAIFSDGTEIEITDYSVSGYDKDIAGEQTITVTYEGKTATFTVTVTDMQDDEDDKDEDPVKTGDSFSPIFLTLLLLLSFGTIIYLTVKRKILNRS